LQIPTCPWPRLPSLVHKAVLTKAKKKIKIDILEEIFHFPLEAQQSLADPNLTNCWHAQSQAHWPLSNMHLDTTEFEPRTVFFAVSWGHCRRSTNDPSPLEIYSKGF